MQVVLMILYVLVGIPLAIPYCLMAGWDAESFALVMFVAPAFLFIWFMVATFAGVIEVSRRGTICFNWRAAFGQSNRYLLSGSLSIFWMWTFYSFLPIILHWSAVLLGKIGYETVSSFLDTHRYASLFYVFMATVMLFCLTGIVAIMWDTIKNTRIRILHR